MAAIALDTLKFARRLKEVGVPEAQAEVQAELMAEAFVYNMDSLVTKDYLDECLDGRFAAQDLKLEKRFNAFGKDFDDRIMGLEKSFESRFAGIESDLKLQRWILAAIAASTVIPALMELFGR